MRKGLIFSKIENPPGIASGRVSLNGAGEETRTLDVHLGKVVLYQLSYTREREAEYSTHLCSVNQKY